MFIRLKSRFIGLKAMFIRLIDRLKSSFIRLQLMFNWNNNRLTTSTNTSNDIYNGK